MLSLPCKEDWAGPLGDERKVGQLALLVGGVQLPDLQLRASKMIQLAGNSATDCRLMASPAEVS